MQEKTFFFPQHLLKDMELTISPPTYCICFDFLPSLSIFIPSFVKWFPRYDYQEMGRSCPLRRVRSTEERNSAAQGAALPVEAAEKTPTPRHCIALHFSYTSCACCLRQTAFSSRTDALPATWHGLCAPAGSFPCP